MSKIETMVEQAEALGLGLPFREFRVLRERAAGLDTARVALAEAAGKARAESGAGLADGGTVDPQALASVAWRSSAWTGDGGAALLLLDAAQVCRSRADTSAAAGVPELFSAMRAEVGRVVKEATSLGAVLPSSVRTARDAHRARGQVLEAWLRLGDFTDRFLSVHRAAEALRAAGFVDRYDGTADPMGNWLKFADPTRLGTGYGLVPPELQLVVAVGCGAGPTLNSAGEATANRRRIVGRRGEPAVINQPMVQMVGHDRNGVPVAIVDIHTVAVPADRPMLPAPR